ncbi:MAG TPA: TIGR03086 family metal-binding protein [Acidimicrobiia bacterium]|nr:TIGR03086 family metal-binding protein [Acidimicrobiia bacterium]
MDHPDLEPAARHLGGLVANVTDEALARPTPCRDYTLGDLIEHVGGLSVGLAAAAEKRTVAGASGPSGDAGRLGDDWRTRIPRDLLGLAGSWRNPDAWSGMTQAGGIDLPGNICGLVTLDELVVHGWDVARASGQPYACDAATLTTIRGFLAGFDTPDVAEGGPFGPPVPVADDAPLVDQVVGLAGRDPGWSALAAD